MDEDVAAPGHDNREQRVLVLAGARRDARLTITVLRGAGIVGEACARPEELLEAIAVGAGAAVIADEALSPSSIRRLSRALQGQPPWSDFPLILVTRHMASETADLIDGLARAANVTLIERPFGRATLLSAVRAALRSRRRQYEARDQLQKLERVGKALREADHRKDQFLATVSHELRTPLTAILGWVRIVRGGRLDDRAIDHAIEVIERNSNNLSQLVTDLLDVSQIIAGKMNLSIQPVDLVNVIGMVIDAVRPAADAKRITITPRLEDGVLPLPADSGRVQQILWNLLSNAVKFTPGGGRVDVGLAACQDKVRITISDTGKGIEPDFLPHLFERFTQADSSTTRAYAGLGLGLAIVRHLVELHGGTVSAHSPGLGAGATFVVDIPRDRSGDDPGAKSVPTVDSQLHPTPSTALQGVRVLTVDDNFDTRELVATILEQQGAEVSSAVSAKAALALLREELPDILICDISMPGDDGYELLRTIRSRPRNAGGNLPAIALTASARQEDRERALQAGFDAYLAKPVEPGELIHVVAKAVRSNSTA
jgi:signal transduction histidine kinase/ActR/RegA family two-component response regulator